MAENEATTFQRHLLFDSTHSSTSVHNLVNPYDCNLRLLSHSQSIVLISATLE